MIEKAYGKINLSLDVVSRREDGYHNLKSIMLPINIYDVIDIELADEMQYQCNIDLPYDNSNIIYRCIEAMKKSANSQQNFKIKIEKNIPLQAGLHTRNAPKYRSFPRNSPSHNPTHSLGLRPFGAL